MRFFLRLITFLFFVTISIQANGVGIVNVTTREYLRLQESDVQVEVNNQVAIITASQTFKNLSSNEKKVKYAFPLPEGASAIGLDYFINGKWYSANIAAQPQDTTLPGGFGEFPIQLQNYLGQGALYFDIDQTLGGDSTLIVELSYVQLLEYEFGSVTFGYPNNYTLIQNGVLDKQSLRFDLNSDRTIETIQLLSHSPTMLVNHGNSAGIEWESFETSANQNYQITYSLSLNELGLFSFSTYQADTLVPDEVGQGFFTFIAEPDPSIK